MATLSTYTYDSDGFKTVENVGESLSTILRDGTDYLQVRGQSAIKTFHTVASHCVGGESMNERGGHGRSVLGFRNLQESQSDLG